MHSPNATTRAFDYHQVKKLAKNLGAKRPSLIAFALASSGARKTDHIDLRNVNNVMQLVVNTLHSTKKTSPGQTTVAILENPSTQLLTSVMSRLKLHDRLVIITDNTQKTSQDGHVLEKFKPIVAFRDYDCVLYYFELNAQPLPVEDLELDGLGDNLLALHAYDIASHRKHAVDVD